MIYMMGCMQGNPSNYYCFSTEKSRRYTIKLHFLIVPQYLSLPYHVAFFWILDWRDIAYIWNSHLSCRYNRFVRTANIYKMGIAYPNPLPINGNLEVRRWRICISGYIYVYIYVYINGLNTFTVISTAMKKNRYSTLVYIHQVLSSVPQNWSY